MDLNKRKHHVKKETQSDKVCTLLDEDESDEELGHWICIKKELRKLFSTRWAIKCADTRSQH